LVTKANGIVVDTNQITKSKEVTLPTANILWKYSTINQLQNVENRITPSTALTPSATLSRSNQRNANRTEGEEVKNATPVPIATLTYSKTMCFIPLPFIVKQFYDGVPNDPLELILAVKAAALDFNNTHTSVAGFKNVDATVQEK
jgi:hypothetical protein